MGSGPYNTYFCSLLLARAMHEILERFHTQPSINESKSLTLAKLQFIPCFVGLRNLPSINLKIKLGLLNHIKSYVLVRATHSYSECHCAILTKKTRIIYSLAKLCLKCIIAIFRNRLLCSRFVWKIMLNSIIP